MTVQGKGKESSRIDKNCKMYSCFHWSWIVHFCWHCRFTVLQYYLKQSKDYRGTQGVDTKTDLGHKDKKQKVNQDNEGIVKLRWNSSFSGEQDVDYEKLLPTVAHKALVTLQDNGSLNYIVTQVMLFVQASLKTLRTVITCTWEQVPRRNFYLNCTETSSLSTVRNATQVHIIIIKLWPIRQSMREITVWIYGAPIVI